ncbi:MAG: glycosyltransferase [Proteobacteria bacterium]|nr:glycosyltransferase [Pseudomonadota bacterium]
MEAAKPTQDPPQVSVVMPLFNAERHIRAAVSSVLDSNLRSLECIVVDDGSTDGSIESLSAISDPRFRLLKIPASRGPSRPRNVGIAEARSNYVALLDADDLLKPDKLSAAVAALDRHPAAGILFTNYERISESGDLLDRDALASYGTLRSLLGHDPSAHEVLIPQEHFARGLLYENFIGTSGVVMRKDALARVGGFDETLTYSEDRDLWFRFAHDGPALYLSCVGHSYRVSPASLSFRPGSRQARSRIAVLERERQRWRSAAAKRQIDRLIAENMSAVAYDERRQGNRLRATATFLKAWSKSPRSRYLVSALGSLRPWKPQ